LRSIKGHGERVFKDVHPATKLQRVDVEPHCARTARMGMGSSL
jgi:hypothetical protein